MLLMPGRWPQLSLLFSILLSRSVSADVFVREDIIVDPDPGAFSICFDYTCKEVTTVSLGQDKWRQIQALFTPRVTDAAVERQRVAEAVSLLEKWTGEIVGTANDKGGNVKGFSAAGHQMDCIDESTNTTTYMVMLSREQLLQLHTVEDRSTRGFFIFGMPHTTAVLKDRSTGQKWAVDSWFHDNGVAPEVVPLSQWRSGWEPLSSVPQAVGGKTPEAGTVGHKVNASSPPPEIFIR